MLLHEQLTAVAKERGTSIWRVMDELGLSRGILSSLRAGKTKSLSQKTLSLIADHLGETVDYIINYPGGIAGTKNPTFDDVQFAFLNGFDDLPDDEKRKRFVEIVGKLSEMMKNESD